MKLFFISAGALVLTGFILLMTRFWGLSQPYQAYDHAFLKTQRPWMVVKVHDVATGTTLIKRNKDAIFWLDLLKTQDGFFLVQNPSRKALLTPDLLKENFRSDKTYYYDLRFLRLYYDSEVLLEDFLAAFPNQKFILNIQDNATDVHKSLVQTVKQSKADDRVLFQSDIELVLQSIKEIQPLGIFGTSQSDLMRLLSFDSIGLLPASPFYGDVFIAPFKVLKRPAFNENILLEMQRRLKPIILGPLKNTQELVDARSLKPDGYIYENSELFLNELDQDPAQ